MNVRELPAPPPVGRVLCRLDELDAALGTLALRWPDGHDMRRVFLLREGDRVAGYVNRCPHALVALDHPPGEFLSNDRAWLQCSFHGALFELWTGWCVAGPCRGRSLESFAVEVCAGVVRVAEPAVR